MSVSLNLNLCLFVCLNGDMFYSKKEVHAIREQGAIENYPRRCSGF